MFDPEEPEEPEWDSRVASSLLQNKFDVIAQRWEVGSSQPMSVNKTLTMNVAVAIRRKIAEGRQV